MTPQEIIDKVSRGEITKEQAEKMLLAMKSKSTTVVLEGVIAYVKDILSQTLKFDKEQLDIDSEFENFGIESVQSINLIGIFEKDLGALSKTLLYEHKTIRELAVFFNDHFRDKLLNGIIKSPVRNHPPQNKTAPIKTIAAQPVLSKRKPGNSEDIAIVGLYGKYPKSNNLGTFWDRLENGEDLLSEIPKSRFDYASLYGSESNGLERISSKRGGFIDDVDLFDAKLFRMMPAEAKMVDPQERLFLQAAWGVIEDAGYTPTSLGEMANKKIGVFVGAAYDEYPMLAAYSSQNGRIKSATGNLASIANRVSYFFDFHGPSLTINTMCSSAMVALYYAIQSIRNNDCNCSIVGGVNLSLHPNKYLFLSKTGILSQKGQCKSFSVGGDGYVPSEGIGAIMIKPLSDAIKAGDHIYGVIKGIGINNNGKTNGYRAPNASSQAELIRSVIETTNIDIENLNYFEGQGTGTQLGDSIELEGLAKAFSSFTSKKQYCALGSVKSNLGHCEAASGIASLTKILLQMKNKTLAPSLCENEANPYFDFKKTPFYLLDEKKKWETVDTQPMLAGLSCFGAGGTNVFLIIESFQSEIESVDKSEWFIPISAASKDQLNSYIKEMRAFVYERLAKQDVTLIIKKQFASIMALDKKELSDDLYFDDIGFGPEEEFQLLANLKAHFQISMDLSDLRGCQTIRQLSLLLNEQIGAESNTVSLESIAYTMQCGRVQMNEKAVFKVKNLTTFIEGMDKYLLGEPSEFIVSSETQDWNQSWHGIKPRRASLPTYPFAREKYWIIDDDFLPLNYTTKASPQKEWLIAQVNWASAPISNYVEKEGDRILIASDLTSAFLSPQEKLIKKNDHIELTIGNGYRYIEHNFLKIFSLVKESLRKRPGLSTTFCVICDEKELQSFSMFYGLFKTLNLENPNFKGKLIVVNNLYEQDLSATIQVINKEWDSDSSCIKVDIENNQRLELQTLYVAPEEFQNDSDSRSLFNQNSSYVITGGAGGVFQSLLSHIDDFPKGLRLILLGRSRENHDKLNKIRRLVPSHVEIVYHPCDVSDYGQLEAILTKVHDPLKPIKGIIHSAGVVLDKFIINKTEQEAQKVLAPKIQGVMNLDNLTRHLPLDYFITFSSESGLFGNLGQVDYAAANSFLDFFAHRRNKLTKGNMRKGFAISFNWPYWEDGGMQIKPEIVEQMANEYGIEPLSTRKALKAIQIGLNHSFSQLFVAQGDIPKMMQIFQVEKKTVYQEKAIAKEPKQPVIVDGEVKVIQEGMKAELSKLIELDLDQIDPVVDFKDYGVDSMTLGGFSETISKKFLVNLEINDLYLYANLNALAMRVHDLRNTENQEETIIEQENIDLKIASMDREEVVQEILKHI